jgi:hypothetical protein
MCTIDAEPCPVWVETPRTARKGHVCHGCGAVIRPGEAYTEIRWLGDGYAGTERECFGCWWIAQVLGAAHHVRPLPSNLWQELQDCMERTEPTHLVAAATAAYSAVNTHLRITPDEWASELAAIKRRWRVGPSGRRSLREGWMRRTLRRERLLTLKVLKGREKPLTRHGATT